MQRQPAAITGLVGVIVVTSWTVLATRTAASRRWVAVLLDQRVQAGERERVSMRRRNP